MGGGIALAAAATCPNLKLSSLAGSSPNPNCDDEFISLLSSMIEMITLRLMIHHTSWSVVFILLTISIIAHNIAYYHKSHHHPFPPSLIADQIITITKFLLSFGRMEVSVSCHSRPVQCWTEFEFAVFEPNLFCLLAAGSSGDEKVSWSRTNTNLRGGNNCTEI